MIAFLFIIAYHFMIELDLKGVYDFPADGGTVSPNLHIAELGVSLFFFISGAGLMLSSKDRQFKPVSFYKKHYLRLLAPFWVVWFCYFLFLIATRRCWPFDPIIPKWRILFTVAGMDGYFSAWGRMTFNLGIGEWFLGCLVLIYFLFPLLRHCMLKNKWATIAAATAYFMVFTYLYSFQMPWHLNFFVKIYDFILGMFLAMVIDRFHRSCLIVTVPIIIASVLPLAVFPGPEAWFLALLSAAVFITARQFETPMSQCRPLQKVLGLVNAYSYEVFLIHHVVIYQFGDRLFGHTLSLGQVGVVLVAELTIIFSLSYCLKRVEKPMIALLSKIPLPFESLSFE